MSSPSSLRRRRLIVAALAGARGAAALAGLGVGMGAAMPLAARAQAAGGGFPNRPITLWVPWPAGGATDITMRLLAELAGQRLGVKVNVENRGGAGGTLAMPVLQQAAADGYTIAQMPQTVFRAPWTRRVLWDPVRDTTPILQVSGVTFGVVVPAESELQTFGDLFTYARAHPRQLTIATNGVGTTPHLVLDELFGREQLAYKHVPYKGTAEQMLAVASGQVMAGVNSNGFAPFVESKQLRLLVTFGAERTKRWPEVPTLKELGYGIVATSPYGLAGPKGMPAEVVTKLHEAFKSAMHDPAHIAELAQFDQELAYLDPVAYGQAMRDTYEAERKNVERLGLARTNE